MSDLSIKSEYDKLQKNRKYITFKNISFSEYKNNYIEKTNNNKSLKLAIIIPFREHIDSTIRINHLKQLYKHMNNFFNNTNITHSYFIINQTSYNKRFNRGKLLNIGFEIANKLKYDIFVTHDVDMLPDDYLLQYYLYIPKYPIHIAYPKSTVKYSYSTYIGGINIYSKKDYIKINGFPNDFWGWGGEDDAIYDRISINNLPVIRPNKGNVQELEHKSFHKDTENTNIKKWENRIDNTKNWKTNGLTDLTYKIDKKRHLSNIYLFKVDL